MGEGGRERVGEGEVIVGDMGVEGEVGDIVGEKVDEGREEEVVGGDDGVWV